MPELPPPTIAGVVLAGGSGRRMGGRDKALVDLDGHPLIARVIARFAPQVGPLFLSANGDPARFAAFGLPVLADPFDEPLGPLAGLAAAALRLAGDRVEAGFLASVPVDTPCLPADVVARLAAALAAAPEARVAVAASRDRVHPVVALHRRDGLDELMSGLADGSVRRVMRYVEARGCVRVDFADVDGVDPFANLNRPEDLAEIAGRVDRSGS
jgi:molybdopterin-guanine dinucleotide biosynthesis protein A